MKLRKRLRPSRELLILGLSIFSLGLEIAPSRADWCDRVGVACFQDAATTTITGGQSELTEIRSRVEAYLGGICARTNQYSVLCSRAGTLHSRLSNVTFFGRVAARGAQFPSSGMRVVSDCMGTALQVSLLKMQTAHDLDRLRATLESIARGELGQTQARYTSGIDHARRTRVMRDTPPVFALAVVYSARLNGHFDSPREAFFGNSRGLISLRGDIILPSRVISESCIAAAQLPNSSEAVGAVAAPVATVLPQFPGDPVLPASVRSSNPAVQACLDDLHRYYYARLRWTADCLDFAVDLQTHQVEPRQSCPPDDESAAMMARHTPVFGECMRLLATSGELPADVHMNFEIATMAMEMSTLHSTMDSSGVRHAVFENPEQCRGFLARQVAAQRWCLADPCVCQRFQSAESISTRLGQFDETNCGSAHGSPSEPHPRDFMDEWRDEVTRRGLTYWRQCMAQLR